jgi:hypothetical protein
MKKFLLIGGGIAVAIAVIIAVVLLSNKKEPIAVTPEPQPAEPVEMCYQYSKATPSGFYDREFLKMTLTGTGGTKVVGEYKNLPAEKDSKVGTFEGVVGPMDPKISARTADVWWHSMAEGMTVTEQLKIVFGEGGAVAQFGEMADRGDGTYVYKDPTKLTNGFQMSQTDCASLDDRIVVEEYLRKNIASIAPKTAVLGGAWYVISVTLDTTAKTGVVVYEDGHIQEKSSFRYVREGGEVGVGWVK